MIRFATAFGILLGAASAWAYGADVASMNESLEFTIERVQGYLKDGQAAKSKANYDGSDFRAAANVAMTEESDLTHAVKHANSGTAAQKAKARSLLAQLHKLRGQALDELFPIWERVLPSYQRYLAGEKLTDLARFAGGKDKRLPPLLKKLNCTYEAKFETVDCK